MDTILRLGDSCENCGRTVKEHLQNPFGIRLEVITVNEKSHKMTSDYILCSEFVDNGVSLDRAELFRRASA